MKEIYGRENGDGNVIKSLDDFPPLTHFVLECKRGKSGKWECLCVLEEEKRKWEEESRESARMKPKGREKKDIKGKIKRD